MVATDRALCRFLDKADYLYTEAYSTRAYNNLLPYFSVNVIKELSILTQQYGELRDYALPRLRTTQWEVLGETDNQIELQKTTRFKEIKTGFFSKIKVSRDFTCRWLVQRSNEGYLVIGIGPEEYI